MRINMSDMEGEVAALDRQLAALGSEVATKIGEKAVKGSADYLKTKLVGSAPVSVGERSPASLRYGHLRDNIKVRVVKSIKVTWIGYRVTSGRAFWGKWYEFGRQGQPARPFWRPTVSREADQVRRRQLEIFDEGIAKAIKKAGGKA